MRSLARDFILCSFDIIRSYGIITCWLLFVIFFISISLYCFICRYIDILRSRCRIVIR